MDYDSIDREMSRWLVSCTKGSTRFFLTSGRLCTDRLERAARFLNRDDALAVAAEERQAPVWRGLFAWEPVTRPSAIN